jgi:hypothetical protein
LYEYETRLAAFPVYTEASIEGFAKVYFDPKATQDRLYAVLAPVVARFEALSAEERHDFRGQLTDYVRLYAFLAQVLAFCVASLEKRARPLLPHGGQHRFPAGTRLSPDRRAGRAGRRCRHRAQVLRRLRGPLG